MHQPFIFHAVAGCSDAVDPESGVQREHQLGCILFGTYRHIGSDTQRIAALGYGKFTGPGNRTAYMDILVVKFNHVSPVFLIHLIHMDMSVTGVQASSQKYGCSYSPWQQAVSGVGQTMEQ